MKEKNTSKIFSEKRKYISILSVTFVLLLLIVLYTFGSFYSIAKEDAISVGKSSVAEQSERLNNFLLKGMEMVRATGFTVDYMIQNGSTKKEIEGFLASVSEDYAKHIDVEFTSIYGFFQGEYVDALGWVPAEGFEPKSRPWYMEAMKGNGKTVVVSPYLDVRTNRIMISVSQMLSDGESVISLDIVMDEMQDFAESIQLNGNGYGFIIDANGLVVAHSDEQEKGKNYLTDEAEQGSQMQEMIQQLLTREEEAIAHTINGEECIVFSKVVQDSWYVVMVVNTQDLFEKVEKNLIINIGLSIIIFGTFAYFCTISYRNREKAIHYANELKDYQLNLEKRVKEQTEEISNQQKKDRGTFYADCYGAQWSCGCKGQVYKRSLKARCRIFAYDCRKIR